MLRSGRPIVIAQARTTSIYLIDIDRLFDNNHRAISSASVTIKQTKYYTALHMSSLSKCLLHGHDRIDNIF